MASKLTINPLAIQVRAKGMIGYLKEQLPSDPKAGDNAGWESLNEMGSDISKSFTRQKWNRLHFWKANPVSNNHRP